RSRTWHRTRPRRGRASDGGSGRRGPATAAAPRPRSRPAPGRRCRRAGRRGPRAPAATRAGTPPRRTPGRHGCRAAATRATGRPNGGESRAHEHEPAALEQDLAAAELAEQPIAGEEPLVDLPARSVLQHSLLPLEARLAAVQRGVEDDELGRDPPRLGEEASPVVLLEVTVEVAREHAVERAVLERQREGVALHVRRGGRLLAGDADHLLALVEADDLAGEVARDEPRAAGDVERPLRRQRGDRRECLVALRLPRWIPPRLVQPALQPPVVVLARAGVVVGLHRRSRVRNVLPLESVPNFSEGRDRGTIDAIGRALSAHARLLDVHADADHNRSVFTVVGDAAALAEALVAAVACARERIDLRRHEGAHPRVGAADVERARTAALDVAARIGELGLPVFLYGAPGRGPAFFRRGGPEELQGRVDSGELAPDFGPSKLDPAAGAVLVGARRPLIAFNVNLASDDVEIARAIAAAVRESGGGFPGVRALGLDLPRAGVVQVSMNVEDWEAAALHELVGRVADEAAAR